MTRSDQFYTFITAVCIGGGLALQLVLSIVGG